MADSLMATAIGLGLSALGLAFGLYQYRVNSDQANKALRRERALKAADRLATFYEDKNVIFAMHVLDHGRETLKPDDGGEAKPEDVVRVNQLPDILRRHWVSSQADEEEAKSKGRFTDRDRRVRDAFDGFLTQLEALEHLIANEVITAAGFGDLFSYWLILLGEIPGDNDLVAHLPDNSRKALWIYIRTYQFNGVVRLFARYGRAAPVGTDGFKARKRTTTLTDEVGEPAG